MGCRLRDVLNSDPINLAIASFKIQQQGESTVAAIWHDIFYLIVMCIFQPALSNVQVSLNAHSVYLRYFLCTALICPCTYNSSSCKHENRLNKEYFAFPWPWKTVLSSAVHAHLSSELTVALLFNVTEESWGLFLLAPRYAPHWHSPLKCHINSNKALPYQGPWRPGLLWGQALV